MRYVCRASAEAHKEVMKQVCNFFCMGFSYIVRLRLVQWNIKWSPSLDTSPTLKMVVASCLTLASVVPDPTVPFCIMATLVRLTLA